MHFLPLSCIVPQFDFVCLVSSAFGHWHFGIYSLLHQLGYGFLWLSVFSFPSLPIRSLLRSTDFFVFFSWDFFFGSADNDFFSFIP